MQLATAPKSRIICMLHARCVSLISAAIDRDGAQRRKSLNHAQNILVELEHALKIDDEISQGLFYLYDYCYCLLENDDRSALISAVAIMTTLRDTFENLLKNR